MGAGSKSGTRRYIWIRVAAYDALQEHAWRHGESVDAVAERLVVTALRARDAAEEIANRDAEYHRSAGAFYAPVS